MVFVYILRRFSEIRFLCPNISKTALLRGETFFDTSHIDYRLIIDSYAFFENVNVPLWKNAPEKLNKKNLLRPWIGQDPIFVVFFWRAFCYSGQHQQKFVNFLVLRLPYYKTRNPFSERPLSHADLGKEKYSYIS
jgi:hypothetical protein